ncbi:MAG: ribonuclease HII [Bacilli bacterium]|nr:ribonuclease HII [Bacilli bacterium]MDD3895497.1 ribonuclease HII [Bacilli bacterium]MDD4407414.1 ribonuclease HII [Bacilli bacterium]
MLNEYEKELNNKGITLIAGVDEAGRGPLVGPVVAAAVILPKNYYHEGINDSKKLNPKKRDLMFEIINRDALSIGISIIENNIIDEINILEATKKAMIEAINNLSIVPEHILIDAVKLDLKIKSTSIIKGDANSISIAAASIIAKVTRDKLMDKLDLKFPEYGFKHHKGYGTKMHMENIKKYGLLDNYRFTFKPINVLINEGDINERKIRKTNI